MNCVEFRRLMSALACAAVFLMVVASTEASASASCRDIRTAISVLYDLEWAMAGVEVSDIDKSLDRELRSVAADIDDIVEDDFYDDHRLNRISDELVKAYRDEDLEDYKDALGRLLRRFRRLKRSRC